VPFVKHALDLFKCKVLPVSKHFTVGVLHNDFNDANIIVSENGTDFRGILDFGDLIHS